MLTFVASSAPASSLRGSSSVNAPPSSAAQPPAQPSSQPGVASSATVTSAGVAAAVTMVGAASAMRRSRKAARKTARAAGETAFLFPGQGAQKVGMCKELVEECSGAKELFEQASDILGYDLLDKCVNGPKESLDTTAVSQPAIFVASMGAVEKLKQEKGDDIVDEATVAMGLSLGEYSALCFAGAMSFEDGVKITKARGEAMQAAADAAESGMVSVIGLDAEKTKALCEKASEDSGKKIQIANYLCKGNYTVSGDKEACAKLAEIAKPEFKARMAVPLAVAGAFHTDFMSPAVEKLEEALAAAEFKTPRVPVVSNVDGKPHPEPEDIKTTLAKQVTGPVMWEQQMQGLVKSGLEKGFECGPGTVIAGIMKRIDKEAAGKITNITV
mmetsp:Transcript_22267/g.51897  ORF Transcript_22267/g.51897 Transcript_22267/m.51897 type:complete len:386 (+) Transcript_22267:138-1295(+)|eukprot:CAMPEP_0178400656 /NCGR_PEP_ID=MMETSP0689_2-20121128/15901_1 /TAXON_ID=160604 /ORGANISM="Amphidinium massartii, Strain CS-259" /LENGTH=385 /DNA_ID=CAMNT_0020021457 /DNA_START=110 /DNA_END=1267 /DNA_ORIENTATION=+